MGMSVLYKPTIILNAIDEVTNAHNEFVNEKFEDARNGLITPREAHLKSAISQTEIYYLIEKYLRPFQQKHVFLRIKNENLFKNFFGNILDELDVDKNVQPAYKEYIESVIAHEYAQLEQAVSQVS